ncbi:MAG: pyridoxal-phosphate dependent enzyme [Chitinophagales bacterium]
MSADFIQKINFPNSENLELAIFRLDLLHPLIQGNKYFKLLYNLEYALKNNLQILTYGGAHSNHIHACALACHSENLACTGIIRGSNFSHLSPTLEKAKELGMQLHFVDRESYRMLRDAPNKAVVKKILEKLNIAIPDNIHCIPEGGSNQLGIQGAKDILKDIYYDFDYVLCPVGTGGTLAGLILQQAGAKEIIGISSLKDKYLVEAVAKMIEKDYDNWEINFDYHFGGYAKFNPDLIAFINHFKTSTGIALCPIYTGKMMYAFYELVKKKRFNKGSKILCLHTGGLQGIEGFNKANNNILL